MSVSIGVAVLAAATVMPLPAAFASDTRPPPPDRTALVLGGTTVPTPDGAYIDAVRNHFIGPTHPGETIDYMAVTAPMEAWPVTGAGRLVWFVIGPQSVWGLNGPGWPDEPLWKLSGLFDRTFDKSVRGGVTSLEDAIAAHPNEALVIYGYSQGAIIANIEKRKLAEQYPEGTEAPDIDFVLSGDLNLPNGGLSARFPGLYVPILDVTLNGSERTDTQFDTVSINRQYDGFADFPLYPLNLVATANALLGAAYLHPYDLEPSLADPGTPPPIHTQTGDTDYYFFETDDLPLFSPLRQLGVPEPVIDVVEPVFRVLVELGYDRSIPPGDPTPARLIPPINPVKVATDLANAVGEGVNNALALTGSAPLLKVPVPGTSADTHQGRAIGSPDKVADLGAVRNGTANSPSALDPLSADQATMQVGTDQENSGPRTPLDRRTKLTPTSPADRVKVTPLEPRSPKRDNRTDGPLARAADHIGHAPHPIGQRLEKNIKKATDSVTKGLSGHTGHTGPTVDSKG